ncbi:hypothetical protein Pan258_48090 [Symmachiella dynata]|nr:hypothetical protein Pan258_48090 [Symmachiella dynata]
MKTRGLEHNSLQRRLSRGFGAGAVRKKVQLPRAETINVSLAGTIEIAVSCACGPPVAVGNHYHPVVVARLKKVRSDAPYGECPSLGLTDEHRLIELLEQVPAVVGAGGGFGVVLDAEGGVCFVADA